MKIALDTRLGLQLEHSSPVLSCMIEYVALVIRRHLVGSDGRTAYERLKGRGDRRRVLEFGEHVLYKPLKGSDHPSRPLDARFVEGIYLGIMDISGEVLVGVGDEVSPRG